MPANVGIIANARNPKAAEAFVEFLLSDDGQQILLDPKIQRLPVRHATYDKAPPDYPNPFKDQKLGARVTFNADLSEARYELINSLYDRLITFRLKELNAAWKAINDAEKKLGAERERRSQAPARRGAAARDVAPDHREGGERSVDRRILPGVEGGAEGRRPAGRVRGEVGQLRAQELH